MIRVSNEEGHYTIKRVKKLPRRGNFNWLYAIIGPKIDKVYRALPDGQWDEIVLGESTDLFKDTKLTYNSQTNTVSITFADGSQKSVEIIKKTSELENDGNGNSNFATLDDLNQTIEAPSFVVSLSNGKTLGRYVNGDTVPAFSTIQDQLKDIAQETIYPTFVNPSFSVSLSDTSTKEVGTAYSATLTGNFNRGQILGDLDGGVWNDSLEQDKRAGLATSYDLDGTNQVGNSLAVNRTVVFGSNTFNGTVNYAEGPQPLDSKGNNFNSPLPSGSLSASTSSLPGRYYRFTYLGARDTHPTVSADIRLLSKAFLDSNNNSSFSLSIPANTSEVVIYTVAGKTVSAQNPATNEVFSPVQSAIIIKDAADVDVNYTENVIDLGLNGFPISSVFNITIS